MNRSYKLILNEITHTWVAVAEITKGRGKQTSAAMVLTGASVLGVLALPASAAPPDPPAANQLPTGGQVVAGQAALAQAGASLTVTQTSNRAAMDWATFNVGNQAQVNFVQPSSSAAILNRVLDPNPSQIFGQINANGQVFLTNPSGVYFGPSASANVGALTATTHSISNADFMAGKLSFSRSGATGKVENEGSLTSALGGYIALLAPEVRNNGVIVAQMGTVTLAAGEVFELQFEGNRLANIRVEPATIAALVENRSVVQAPGGWVILSARAVDQLQGSIVKNSGNLEAKGLVHKGGRIVLEADHITLANGSKVDASGISGGGEVLIGGGWQGGGGLYQAKTVTMEQGATIDVSANQTGTGGTAVLWSDVHNSNSQTRAFGSIWANGGAEGGDGGRIETSGHWLDVAGSQGGASAVNGMTGMWLLDPYNVTIASTDANGFWSSASPDVFSPSATGSTISAETIESRLSAGTSVTVTTDGGGTEGGDITVASSIAKGGISDATLTLKAGRNISLLSGADISATSGKLNVQLWADSGKSGDGIIRLANADINTNGGWLTFGELGSTAVINGSSVLVGGDVYFGGSTAQTVSTGGGNLNIYGDTILANPVGVTVNSNGGIANFAGSLNSGNQYTWVPVASGSTKTWNDVRVEAKTGSGTNLNDSYLVTITSRQENAITALTAGYQGAWIGAWRENPGVSYVWTWADGPEAGTPFFTQVGVGGTPTTGVYSNFGPSTPNGALLPGSESVGQLVAGTGKWDDINPAQSPSTGFAPVQGFVRETNLAASRLTLNAGIGAVTFAQAAGNSKPVGNLSITAKSIAMGNTVAVSGDLKLVSTDNLSVANVYATGKIDIATNGNLTLSQQIRTDDNTSSAIVLNAGYGNDAGTKTGGDIIVSSGSLNYGSGGRATLYTGSVAGSTKSSALAPFPALAPIDGSGRFRYNSNAATAGYDTATAALGTGTYLIYREQPTLTITAINPSAINYGSAVPTFSASISGLVNEDTNLQAFGMQLTVATDGIVSTSGHLTAASHTLTASAVDRLGYKLSFVPGSLVVNKLALLGATIVPAASTYASVLTPGAVSFNNLVGNDLVSSTASVNTSGLSSSGNPVAGSYTQTASTTLAGSDKDNYSFAGFTTATANYTVDRLALTIFGITAADKGYDGNRATLISTSTVTKVGLISDDVVNLSATGLFDTKNVGTAKTVTLVSSYSGADASNYTITDQATTSANITPKSLLITANNDAKFVTQPDAASYNGVSYNGLIPSEGIEVLGGTLTYTRTNSSVNAAGVYSGVLAPSGLTSSNYTISFANGDYTIAPADRLLVTVQNASLTYGTAPSYSILNALYLDGSNVIHTLTPASQVGNTFSYNDGAGGTAVFTLGPLSGQLSTAGQLKVGSYNVGASNVTETSANFDNNLVVVGAMSVDQKQLTATASGATKVYDGNNSINNVVVGLTGLVPSDLVTVAGNGAFSQKNVGANLGYSVSNVTLGGADASNYFLSGGSAVSGINGAITPKALAISGITAANKTYDGSNLATVSTAGISSNILVAGGMVAGDVVQVAATGTFNDKNVASGKTVTLNSIYSGSDVGNYTITDQTITTANITPKSLVITGTSAVDKTYDGNTTAIILPGSVTGFVGNESVNATANGTFDSKDAGIRSASASYTLIDGTNGGLANNYSLDNTTGHVATINKASLTVTADDKVRLYGQMNPPLTTSVSGFVNGETANTANGFMGTGSATTQADISTPAGIATITAGAGSLSATNYDFTHLVDGVLTIQPVQALVLPPKVETRQLATPATDPPRIGDRLNSMIRAAESNDNDPACSGSADKTDQRCRPSK